MDMDTTGSNFLYVKVPRANFFHVADRKTATCVNKFKKIAKLDLSWLQLGYTCATTALDWF